MKNKILGVFLFLVLTLTLTGCGNKSVLVKENLDFELNGEVTINSIISDENKLEIINKEDIIDTSKVGKQEVIIKYLDDKKEKEQVVNINVLDKEKPIISINKNEITLNQGDNVDLKSGVTATDNYDGDISDRIEITGTVDVNKDGKYEIKYNVSDSSGNTADEVIRTYIVEEIYKIVLNKDYKLSTNDATLSVRFANNTIRYNTCVKEGGCISMEGTYTVKGNTINVTYTLSYHLAKEVDGEKINEKVTYKLSKDAIEANNKIYKLS